MGDWNITIRGTGAHHNKGYAKDANRMAADFVRALKEAGHQVKAATITHGAEDDISDPEAYRAQRDSYEGALPGEPVDK